MCVTARVCVRTCVYTCTLAFIARACASSPPVRRRFVFLNERQLDWWGYRNDRGSSTAARGGRRRPFRRSWGIAWFGRRTAHPYFCCSLRRVHSRLNFVIALTRVSALRVLFFLFVYGSALRLLLVVVVASAVVSFVYFYYFTYKYVRFPSLRDASALFHLFLVFTPEFRVRVSTQPESRFPNPRFVSNGS